MNPTTGPDSVQNFKQYLKKQGQDELSQLSPDQAQATAQSQSPNASIYTPAITGATSYQSPTNGANANPYQGLIDMYTKRYGGGSSHGVGNLTFDPNNTQGLPQSILNARQDMGDAQWNKLCEAFVEQQTLGHHGVYGSAIDAWNQQQPNAVQGTKGITPGDLVYFDADPSNGGYGHTGIYSGNGKFVSATDNGVQENDLNKWINSTGQKYLGYVRPQKK